MDIDIKQPRVYQDNKESKANAIRQFLDKKASLELVKNIQIDILKEIIKFKKF